MLSGGGPGVTLCSKIVVATAICSFGSHIVTLSIIGSQLALVLSIRLMAAVVDGTSLYKYFLIVLL